MTWGDLFLMVGSLVSIVACVLITWNQLGLWARRHDDE